MSFLFWKNFGTFLVVLWMLLVSLVSHFFTKSPVCKVRSDGKMFYSCGKIRVSAEPNDDMTTTKVPLYDFGNIVMISESLVFLLLCFMNNNCRNPFSLSSEKSPVDLQDLTTRVLSYIKIKVDMRYVVIDAAKHIADAFITISLMILTYNFSINCALSMGYSLKEAKFYFFPSVKKCHFDYWPYQLECKVHQGSVYQFVMGILLIWYAAMTLAVMFHMGYQFGRYFRIKQKLKETYFTNMEDWLVQLCGIKNFHLDQMAKCIGMRNFEEAAQHVILDPRINMYATKNFYYNITSEATAGNTEMVIANSWYSHHL